MRLFGFTLIALASVAASPVNQLDSQALADIASSIEVPRQNSAEYASAFRQLAQVLQDTSAQRALDSPPGSKEYQQALHALRSDISRAQWLFYDDKSVSDNLDILAKKIESAY